MMENFNFGPLIITASVGLFCYWRGFINGRESAITEEVEHIMSNVPINITITQGNDTMYAHMLGSGIFLGQDTDETRLIDKIQDKFPDRDLIVSYETL
jgi:hypothetical protein